MVYGKRTSLREAPTSVFKVFKWWPELARDAGINATREIALTFEVQGISILLPRDYTTLPSSDNNIPVSLRVPIALYPLRAEELITWPTNNTFITLPTSSSPQHAYISKTYTINSSKRLWEIKEILQIRIDQGQGSSPKCVKRYLVRWTTSRLSAKELWYARKTWEIVKTSRDVRAGRGALDQKTNVQWAPSWVSSSDFNPRLGASESAKYQSVQ